MEQNAQNIYEGKFETEKTLELYSYFYEKGVKLLANNGIISFITASLFIKGMKFLSLRNFLEKNTSLIKFRNEGDNVFFNVEMPTCTMILMKKTSDWSFKSFHKNGKILEKIEANENKIEDIAEIMRGFEIGRNLVSTEVDDVKFLTGSNVQKYVQKNYSYITKKVFEQYKKEDYFFTTERILIRETGSCLTALYLNEKLYSNRSLYSIIIKDKNFNCKYVLACINSNILQFFYEENFKSETELFPKIRISQVKQLPIPVASQNQQQLIISLVDQILATKKGNPQADTSALEHQIDLLVYHLYGLTYEEAQIIDNNLTEEEFNTTLI